MCLVLLLLDFHPFLSYWMALILSCLIVTLDPKGFNGEFMLIHSKWFPPYKVLKIHRAYTVHTQYIHLTYTVQVPYKYHTSTVQVPYCMVHFRAYVIFSKRLLLFSKWCRTYHFFENSFFCCSFLKIKCHIFEYSYVLFSACMYYLYCNNIFLHIFFLRAWSKTSINLTRY